jgi:glucose dehydrogenase
MTITGFFTLAKTSSILIGAGVWFYRTFLMRYDNEPIKEAAFIIVAVLLVFYATNQLNYLINDFFDFIKPSKHY